MGLTGYPLVFYRTFILCWRFMSAASSFVVGSALSKRYGEGPIVLEGIELTIKRGDFVSLIGPSGCGKSTLLKLISGLSPVTSGKLTVAGTIPEKARKQAAFIFQEATLLPWLTVRKNVELPMRLRGLSKEVRAQKTKDLLSLVRLKVAADKFPRQLSGGMKMRVSIARALSLTPELLLLDEPFGALDEMTRYHLNEQLLALRERAPFTAVFVTHSVGEAVFLSNRIFVMSANPGRIFAEVRVNFLGPRLQTLRNQSAYHKKVSEVSALLHAAEGSKAT